MSTVLHTSPDYATLAQMFWHGVRTRNSATMMRQKDLGIWRSYSWSDVGEIVADVAGALLSLGLQAGDVVSVLSNTNREWVWADLGALTAGAVVNGIYPTDAAAQVEYLCSDSRTKFLFVEDEEQLDKYLEVRDRLPELRQVIVFDMEGLRKLDDPQVMSLERLLALGQAYRKQHPDLVEQGLRARSANDLAILVYTSGTTGKPKGAMLSHANLVASCLLASAVIFKDLPAGSERVAFLPLCHVAERVGGEYTAIQSGHILNFVENPDTVFENLREVQPSYFAGVPRIWEKVYSSTMIALKEASG